MREKGSETISYQRYSECTWFVFIFICVHTLLLLYKRRKKIFVVVVVVEMIHLIIIFQNHTSSRQCIPNIHVKYEGGDERHALTDWLALAGKNWKVKKIIFFLLFSVRLSTFGKHLNQFFLLAVVLCIANVVTYIKTQNIVFD